jgi:hypothetical protein
MCRAPGEAQRLNVDRFVESGASRHPIEETPALTTNFANYPLLGPKGQKSRAFVNVECDAQGRIPTDQ